MDQVYKEKETCYGCNACQNICPVSAIHMEPDTEGFSYPVIDHQKCIDCMQCVKVCPFHHPLEDRPSEPIRFQQRYFAVQHKDRAIVAKSSSGGMFTALSDCILDHGGTVYGVAFDKAFVVRHMRAKDKKTCDSFIGSKYIQSSMGAIYSMLADDLLQGRTALFIGTPCQVAGVKSYILHKRGNLDNLLLCDFICHGVASPKVWNSYMDYFRELYKGGLSHYEFRGKKDGWHEWKPILRTGGNDISTEFEKRNSFLLLYQTCFLSRPSCYSCKYTSYERCSDLTLGDFWNIGSVCPEMDDDTGTSQVLVNTDRGQKWFELCCGAVNFRKCSREDVWQPHLEYPTNASSRKRERFWKEYSTLSFEKILKKYGSGDMITKCKNFAVPLAKKMGLYVLMGKMYRILFVKKTR